MPDMRYMDQLEGVVADMVALLRLKTETYGDSWKRRGGPGAWFTTVRPWDRLEGILGKFGGDVFAAIALKPGGEDGTALACVRDVMAYMILIEAEARVNLGVAGHTRTEEKEEEDDIYAMLAEKWGISRTEAKRRAYELVLDIHPRPSLAVDDGSPPRCDECGETYDAFNSIRHRDYPDKNFCTIDCAQKHEADRTVSPRTRQLLATPESGSHHALAEDVEPAGEVTEDTQGRGDTTVDDVPREALEALERGCRALAAGLGIRVTASGTRGDGTMTVLRVLGRMDAEPTFCRPKDQRAEDWSSLSQWLARGLGLESIVGTGVGEAEGERRVRVR